MPHVTIKFTEVVTYEVTFPSKHDAEGLLAAIEEGDEEGWFGEMDAAVPNWTTKCLTEVSERDVIDVEDAAPPAAVAKQRPGVRLSDEEVAAQATHDSLSKLMDDARLRAQERGAIAATVIFFEADGSTSHAVWSKADEDLEPFKALIATFLDTVERK